jgi:branched-subunit amino acid aminotransferase/4-amino-4-deoxychorismate lyase
MHSRTVIHIGGRYLPASSVEIPILERGFLFGDGVFETIRTYGRRPFRLGSHLARLRRSAEALRIPVPLTESTLTAVVLEGIDHIPEGEVYVRLVLTRGVSELSYLLPEKPEPRVYTFFDSLPAVLPEIFTRGVKVTTWHEEKAGRFAQVKLMNSVPAILARHTARERGAYEVIRLDAHGHLVEGYISNVFAVKDGSLHTPPVSLGLLDGVTRATILELAARRSVPVVESLLPVREIGGVDELFLSHSTAGVVPIVAVDDTPIANGRIGEITRVFAAWFASLPDHPDLMETVVA